MSITATPSHSFLSTDEPVRVVHTQVEWTVAQAAEFLDMPEDCVEELLKIGALKFRQDGNRRLVERDDLFKHDQDRKRMRAGILKIIRLSEEMGLYDD